MVVESPLSNRSLFLYLATLTLFFIFLELSFCLQSANFYLTDFYFVSSQLQIPATIWPGIVFFIAVQVVLHVMFCVMIYFITRCVISAFNVPTNKQLSCAIWLWCLAVITLLVANQHYFPNSKFAGLSGFIFFAPLLASICFYILCAGWIALTGAIVVTRTPSLRGALFAMTVPLLILFLYPSHHQTGSNKSTATRPNIIIIGIDSLRPDFTNYFGNESTNTPFIDELLNTGTVFNEAVTPLARTFPSWVSILSGAYPRENKIRSNLAKQDKANVSQTLPAILRKNSYQTIYATDETRFSNISYAFGFDQIITPPVGLNDFLIGTFNDFPLSNFLVNTTIGKWLFPYNYGNRPSFVTYDPNSFLTLLTPTLQKHYQQPVFLAVHFCLPHTPYLWSDSQSNELTPLQRYEQSINRADQQVKDFVALLKQNHLLDHAILVLLSDHGEALELKGDRITEEHSYVGKQKTPPIFYPPSLEDERWNQSVGHGTDVLGLTQYHSLLGFKFFGLNIKQSIGLKSGVISMTEIKPALLDLIGLANKTKQPSRLAPIITQEHATLKTTHIFLESDYSPESIHTVYPETKQVVLEGVHLFQIDPITTRFTVKPSMEGMIIESKQFADIYGKWMLALYPQNKHTQLPILVNLETGDWTDDLQSSFAKTSPVKSMLTALKNHYGQEIKITTR